MPQVRLILLIVAVTACSTLFSLIVAKLGKWHIAACLLVPLLLILFAGLLLVKAKWFSIGFGDLGYGILAMVAFVSGIVTFLLTELGVRIFRRDKIR